MLFVDKIVKKRYNYYCEIIGIIFDVIIDD